MRLIIEGPDGSGKSTLAEALKQKLDLQLIHFSVPPHDNLYRWFMSFVPQGRAIWDRSFYSELVYQPLFFGKEPRLDLGAIRRLERGVSPAMVIWCTADIEVLQQRLRSQESSVAEIDQHVLDNTQKYVDAYAEVRRLSLLPGIVYDSGTAKVDEFVEFMQQELTRE